MYIYQDEVSLPEEKLKNLAFDWKNKSVIELGCNIGKLGLFVLENGAESYKGYETDGEMVRIGIERYGLDIEKENVIESKKKYESDVVVAMALFHHFKDRDLEKVIKKIQAKELIFEVPTGNNDVGLYQTRDKEYYEELIKETYGSVEEIVESGATNDPYNKRLIYRCKRSL